MRFIVNIFIACTASEARYVSESLLFHTGFYLGRPGEDCNTVCNRTGFYCNPELKMDGTTDNFHKFVNCTDKSKADYSTLYHPSYKSGSCEGYQNLPNYINCSIAPSDGGIQRLCDCIAPG